MTPTDVRPFIATGNTIIISATSTTSSTAITAPRKGEAEIPGTMRIYNAGTDLVFINQGATSAGAAATNTTATSPSIPIAAGNTETLQMAADTAFIGAITASSTATVYVTPGQGL